MAGEQMRTIEQLLLQTQSDDGHARCVARKLLKPLIANDEGCLIELMRHGNAIVRTAVPEVLSFVSDHAVRGEVLTMAFRDPQPMVLASACWAIESIEIHESKWWEHTSRLLNHNVWYVRQAALNAVSTLNIGDSERLSAVRVSIDDPVWQVRAAAAEVLGKVEHWGQKAIGLLLRLAQDPEAGVRAEAATALGLAKPDLGAVGDALVELCLDRDWDVRIRACEAVEAYGAAAAFAAQALRKNQKLSDPVLRDAALRALSRMENNN